MEDAQEVREIWQDVMQIVKKEVIPPLYDTWFKNAVPLDITETRFDIGFPNEFSINWVEKRYKNLLTNTLKYITKKDLRVNFINLGEQTPPDKAELMPLPTANDEAHAEPPLLPNLNKKYTFSSFVIGNSNRFAHAASLAVAEAPAKAYNPLFIYGGVGLGKTHLMHAIGHRVLTTQPQVRVLYVSSEKFTNELINAIKDDKTENFRNYYRNIDILLIDDIQFLAKKERTQEEFFHTFNALHEADKQIVISSDRPPKEIPSLEDRLRSRFEWGLIADIQPPDLETRIAILRKKADQEGLEIPNDVMVFIASRIDTNIRELEGALIRVVAYASLIKAPIDIGLATEALKNILPHGKKKQITLELIQQVVANYFKIRVDELTAKKRSRNVAYPRQIAMYLCREMTDLSLPRIGELFGGRDHTTVIHAHDKINREKQENAELHRTLDELGKQIAGA